MLRRCLAGALLIVAAAASNAQQRAWIATEKESPSSLAAIRIRFAPEQALPAAITFETDAVTTDPTNQGVLSLTIMSPEGTAIHSGSATLNLASKLAPATFAWQPENLPDGRYTGEFLLKRPNGTELARYRLTIRLLTSANIANKLVDVKTTTARLRTALGAFGTASMPAYPALHVAIAEDYAPIAEAALAAGDWREAADFADYLASLLQTANTELSVVTPSIESYVSSASRSPIAINASALATAGQPVFLFGSGESIATDAHLDRLNRFGLQLAVYRVGMDEALPGPDSGSEALQPLADFLDRAAAKGIYVIVQFAPERVPGWVVESDPTIIDSKGGAFAYNLMNPKARTILARYVASVSKALAGRNNVVSLSLAQDPTFQLPEQVLREGLIQVARSRYKDYDRMNRDWKTRYMAFEEIEVDWNSRRRAYRYDLQTYHQELGTQFFAWMATMVRESAPGLPVQVQFADSAFTPKEAESGVDRESVLAFMDLAACAAIQPLDGTELSFGAPVQASYYALLRSMRQLPVVNTADGFTIAPGVTGHDAFRRVRSMMWEAALAGLNASAMTMGVPGESGVLARPEYIDGFATAHLDLNRLAPIVNAYQQSPAPVRVLWSMSSKIFDHGDPFLASARRAYEGCTNFGAHTAYISEREIERNGLAGVEVLVIPRAYALTDQAFLSINQFIERGGVTVRLGEPIAYNEHGLGRADSLAVSTRTIYIPSDDTPRAYLDALDAAYDLAGTTPPPRPVNDFGYPLDGVKSRFVVHERIPYLYLINLRESAVTVKLNGPHTAGLDLVSGNRFQFPEAIDPLTPMLLQLDVDPNTIVAAADAASTPTEITLQPIGADPESKPIVKSAPLRHAR